MVAYVFSSMTPAKHLAIVRQVVQALQRGRAYDGVYADVMEIDSSRRAVVQAREHSQAAVEDVLRESRECFGDGSMCNAFIRHVPREWLDGRF
jgi:hypothetical protein